MAFYEQGLNFACAGCGRCCRIKGGYVWLRRGDLAGLVEASGLSEAEFRRRYVETLDGKLVLKSFPNGDCILYSEEEGCRLYDGRPVQCRAYPFWPDIIKSRGRWIKEARLCPGIGGEATIPAETIRKYIEEMDG